MSYTETILEHFYNPHNVGVIKGANGMGKVASTVCGDIIRFYVQVEDETIKNATFQAYGNPASIAVFSVLTDMVMNKSIFSITDITKLDIEKEIGKLPKEKSYVLDLAIEAIKETVLDYERKLKGEKKPRKKQIRITKKSK